MNERDWVDWIVIAASILSSCSIIMTIIVYVWQKKDNRKLEAQKEVTELNSLKMKLKISVDDFELYLIKAKGFLCINDANKSIEQLGNINFDLMKVCLHESSKIDVMLFDLILNLTKTAIGEVKLIEKIITKKLENNNSSYSQTIEYCETSINKIKSMYELIDEYQ
ncbi:hypothetical protein R2242_15770 [Proteus mirabilis]|uniref:hypothetical protein n=2 Tax=Proteus mirabilis TaxID=584 RepID=UPI001C06A2EE|nr:hypothetical protein [Proteus mirabilis]EKU0464620.1 hypothetical protein [Proteus mirabilis]MBU3054021.1 hypothetical protein [Proteus mirabilis]